MRRVLTSSVLLRAGFIMGTRRATTFVPNLQREPLHATQAQTSSSPLQRLASEVLEAHPRQDPASMTNILDIVTAIVEVKTNYEAKLATSTLPDADVAMSSNKRLVRRVDQRYLKQCVLRFDELCELEVRFPEKHLLREDLNSSTLLDGTLSVLVEAVKFMDRPASYPNPHESSGGAAKRAFSPWLGPSSCELIGVWTSRHWGPSALKAMSTSDLRRNLANCCELTVGDLDVISNMCARLSAKESVQRLSNPVDAIAILHLVTLSTKRLPIKLPDISHLLATISFIRRLTTTQALSVLSSLVRIRETRSLELITTITRKEIAALSTYSLNDCIFALRACLILTGASEPYVAELLNALVTLAPTLTPRQLANVCHLLTMLRNSRRHSQVIRTVCAKEVRRLMPALLARTKTLLKQFSVKDARYVIDCFYTFQVQHPLIFTQLTSEISE